MRIRLRNAIRLGHKAIAVILLGGFVFAIAGIPTVRRVPKDRSRPFPCQDNPCGCASADECWHHCCCMNNQQKLEWARKHGVTPPDFVVAAAARETQDSTQTCCGGACCQHRADADEEKHDRCPKCRDRHHAEVAETHDRDGKGEVKVTIVLSDQARQCRGLPSIVLLLANALPGAARVSWNPIEALAGYVVDAPLSRPSVDLPPPVPPPRLDRGTAA